MPAAPAGGLTFQGMAVHADPGGDLYVIRDSRRTFLHHPLRPLSCLKVEDVRVESGRIVAAGDGSRLELPAAGSVNSGLLPDSGGLVIRDYQLYRGEDPVLIDGHTVGLGRMARLYITIEHGPTAGMYWLRAGSSDWVMREEVCWKAGSGGGGMQGRLVERGTNTPVEQGERIPPAAASFPTYASSMRSSSESGEIELKRGMPQRRRRDEEQGVSDPDLLPQSGRAAERYVVAHGSPSGEITFVPGDLRVQFYSEEGEAMARAAPFIRHLGVKVPTPSMKEPDTKINNYILSANTREEWGEFRPLLEVLPESEILFIGHEPLPEKIKLCSDPGECEGHRRRQKSTQPQDGIKNVIRHRDACTGLFGPLYAKFLGEVTHLLICRGSAPPHLQHVIADKLLDSYIRKKLGGHARQPVSGEEREKFWRELTPEDIDAMPPEGRATILSRNRPVVSEYFARERKGDIGLGADPGRLKAAIIALTVASNSANVTAKRYQQSPDSTERVCADRLLKASGLTLKTTHVLMLKINKYEGFLERKESISVSPVAPPRRPDPGGEPEGRDAAGQPDPLIGFSLSRQELGQVLDMSRLIEKQTPRPPDGILKEWRQFTEATKKFLDDPDISRVSSKDKLRGIGGL
ncbi:hypothetical protein [Streptomyces sp. NPDC055085]